MEVFTRDELVEYAITCSTMQTVYLWGGIGDKITKDIISELRSRYPQKYTAEYCALLENYVGKDYYGFDCSGLIKHYFMGGFSRFIYNSKIDWNTKMMFEKAALKGSIENLPDIPGVIVYMEGHVGIYIGNGYVIESTPAFRIGGGVQKTLLHTRGWTDWFQHILFEVN